MRAVFLAALLALPISYKPSVTVLVGTSAIILAGAARHTYVKVWNTDATKTLYVDTDSSVTTASGIPVPPGNPIEFSNLAQGQIVYGVTTSGTLDARVKEGFEQ